MKTNYIIMNNVWTKHFFDLIYHSCIDQGGDGCAQVLCNNPQEFLKKFVETFPFLKDWIYQEKTVYFGRQNQYSYIQYILCKEQEYFVFSQTGVDYDPNEPIFTIVDNRGSSVESYDFEAV